MKITKTKEYASKNFKWKEFYCSKAKHLLVSDLTLSHIELLQQLRNEYASTLLVNSGYRSPEHNEAIGGAEKSMHLESATDIAPHPDSNHPSVLDWLASKAKRLGFTGIGKYDTFIHLDCRTLIDRESAEWDNRSSK